jgi:hypothetical protein
MAEFTGRLGGQIQVRLLKIRRAADISAEILEQIAAGGRPGLFEAEIRLTWNNVTVIVDDKDDEDDYGVHDDEERDGDLDRS